MKNIDIHSELIIKRWGNGIKLVEPDATSTPRDISHSIANVLALPFNISFVNTGSAIQRINEAGAIVSDLWSEKNCVGKTMFDLAAKKCAQSLIANDREVMSLNRIKIIEEEGELNDGCFIQALSVKAPFYNKDNKIIGVFCCGIILDKQSLAEALIHISRLGLLDTTNVSLQTLDGISLSKRETQCLQFYVRGKTVKSIAALLDLSHRTVEFYLANIKRKLNISSKHELIEKTIDYFN
ncbi:MAG: LuxR C-terminal-related transcriptional regulator [Gammaproteobacteria bacterium]